MKKKSDSVIRIGVIGLGMAGAAMIPAIEAHPNFVLAGAADLNPELRARFARDHSCNVSISAAELVCSDDVDAVYIATPHQFHREHLVLAAEHGKHAVVEKPMALSLDDCDEMIAASGRNGITLLVGHTHSFDPAIRAMSDLIASGEVGRLSMIAMWNYTDFIYRPRRPEELDTSQGGGILFNQIPHQVEIARLLAQSEVRKVCAMADILDRGRPTEGSCMAMLGFADGAAASLVYSGYDRFDSDELHGWIGESGQPKSANHGSTRRALAAMHASGNEVQARSQRYGYGGDRKWRPQPGQRWHQPHFGTLIVSCANADLRQSADGVLVYSADGVREIEVPLSGQRPGRSEVLDEFYNAVADGIPPVHDGLFARGTLEVCLAIQESSSRGSEVVLPIPQQQEIPIKSGRAAWA